MDENNPEVPACRGIILPDSSGFITEQLLGEKEHGCISNDNCIISFNSVVVTMVGDVGSTTLSSNQAMLSSGKLRKDVMQESVVSMQPSTPPVVDTSTNINSMFNSEDRVLLVSLPSANNAPIRWKTYDYILQCMINFITITNYSFYITHDECIESVNFKTCFISIHRVEYEFYLITMCYCSFNVIYAYSRHNRLHYYNKFSNGFASREIDKSESQEMRCFGSRVSNGIGSDKNTSPQRKLCERKDKNKNKNKDKGIYVKTEPCGGIFTTRKALLFLFVASSVGGASAEATSIERCRRTLTEGMVSVCGVIGSSSDIIKINDVSIYNVKKDFSISEIDNHKCVNITCHSNCELHRNVTIYEYVNGSRMNYEECNTIPIVNLTSTQASPLEISTQSDSVYNSGFFTIITAIGVSISVACIGAAAAVAICYYICKWRRDSKTMLTSTTSNGQPLLPIDQVRTV